MAAYSSVGRVPLVIWAATVDPADVPMMRSASVTSTPASDRPAMRPSSHALPTAPPPARTKARLVELPACLVAPACWPGIGQFPCLGEEGVVFMGVAVSLRNRSAVENANYNHHPGEAVVWAVRGSIGGFAGMPGSGSRRDIERNAADRRCGAQGTAGQAARASAAASGGGRAGGDPGDDGAACHRAGHPVPVAVRPDRLVHPGRPGR